MEKKSSYRLHFLLSPFFILPLFAIANTCIPINSNWYEGLNHNTLGYYAWSGDWETTGIWLFSFVAVTLGICTLPKDLNGVHILGAECWAVSGLPCLFS
jgi:NhaA family Na+:H+ antiporter